MDYNTLPLEKGKDLADWESSVANRKIDNISKGIREHTSAQVYALIATLQLVIIVWISRVDIKYSLLFCLTSIAK